MGLLLAALAPAVPLVEFTLPAEFEESSSAFNLGFSFAPSSDIWIVSLGVYDYGPSGVPDGLAGPQQVGLWAANEALLRSAVVDVDAALDGLFRYSTVAPVLLEAGSVYVIGTQGVGASGEGWIDNPSNFQTASEIQYMDARYAFVEADDPLTFPRESLPGSLWFGTNAQYVTTAIPEPGAMMLAGAGLVALLLARRRRYFRSQTSVDR